MTITEKQVFEGHTIGKRVETAISQADKYSISNINLKNGRLLVEINGGTKHMIITIDPENHVIEHSGCGDFKYRCMDDNKLCKHLIILFMHYLDPRFVKDILHDIHKYSFLSTISGTPNILDEIPPKYSDYYELYHDTTDLYNQLMNGGN